MSKITMPLFSTVYLIFAMAGAIDAKKCNIQFDGRVPTAFTPADFDTSASPFNNGFVFGKGLKASDVVTIPNLPPSLFDGTAGKPFQVNIDDRSIFAPTETNVQTGFRRAEMLPMSNNGTDPSTSGIKTVHWSMMKDPKKPFNLTHEYQMVFLESSIFSSNQFALKYGDLIGIHPKDSDVLHLFGNSNTQPSPELFTTKFTEGVFHNFALTLDFTKNLTQVYYSQGSDPLVPQGKPQVNDIQGQGQFHFGVLKKSINGTGDLTKSGFHESGINEGLIFGGIFQEDSADGCVTLSP
ncbi:uncharacterized protein CTRU02_211353 [Colletotrichum truncatum]|uniref:Uncharacterized protein n=1 Tax=Colletotrichum truncatum TaxID=5467 RepID=A0ACC3YRN0_COLTU|nr:uncharacterized protein CTRU02_02130 [Colletotrichum truncatum]KAF6799259.1 hypothetical protein CTRU02_02130 [Colletotrichum truncatum]